MIPHFFEDKHGFESLTRQACMIRAIGECIYIALEMSIFLWICISISLEAVRFNLTFIHETCITVPGRNLCHVFISVILCNVMVCHFLALPNLGHKNLKGCVHGKVKREWSEDKLRRLGVYLLHEAYVCYTYGMVQPHPVMEKDINL